jgi:outer membrane lipoprotein-sorting protein
VNLVAFLRLGSTRRVVGLLLGVAALLVLVAVAAGAALGGGGQPPPAKPLSQAIHDALSGKQVDGVTAYVRFTSSLFNGMTTDQSSALLKGGSGRLWLAPDKLRLELQSDNGDAQIVVRDGKGFVYDGPSDTAYTFAVGSHKSDGSRDGGGVPTIAQIEQHLTDAQKHVAIVGPDPKVVADQPAYELRVTPKDSGGLVGAARLAWDAANGVPLEVAVYPRGSATPALQLEVTDIAFGAVDPSVFDLSVPAGARTVDLGGGSGAGGQDSRPRSKPSFKANAPAALASRARRQLKPAGDGYLALYGKGLDTISVAEHPVKAGDQTARPSQPQSQDGRGPIDVPSVKIGGVKATAIGTSLGGVVSFKRDGISYNVAGSQPLSVLEGAAAGL